MSQTQFSYALLQILIEFTILLKVLSRFIFHGLRFSVIIGRRKKVDKAVDMKSETKTNMHIPSDTTREIFLYLPCKSLCRFRCVSKQWRSCIDDDQFIEEHRKRNTKASHILSWESWDGVVSTKLQLFSMSMDSYAHIKTIQTYKYNCTLPSSYGMVCLHGCNNKEIALFNPSSQEIIPLPNLQESYSYDIGFGFDSRSRRYKIVQLIAYNGTIRRFHILTVTRNGSSWRSTDVVKPGKIRVELFGNQPICVDGVLYWDTWNSDTGTNVLIFDLSTEEMHIIKSPAPWKWMTNLHSYRRSLAMLEGNLCCYHMELTNCELLTMNLWKFDNHVGWTPWYQFQIYGSIFISSFLIPLCFHDDKTVLFQENSYNQSVQRVYIYHIEDQTLKIYPMSTKEGVIHSSDLTVHSETMNHSLD